MFEQPRRPGLSRPELRDLAVRRTEAVGGALLLCAAVPAVAPGDPRGPARPRARMRPGHAHRTADVPFPAVVPELRREPAGDPRNQRAALPVVPAVRGMIAPALAFLAINAGTGDSRRGSTRPTTPAGFAAPLSTALNTRSRTHRRLSHADQEGTP